MANTTSGYESSRRSYDNYAITLKGTNIFCLEDDILFAESLKMFLCNFDCDIQISNTTHDAISMLTHANATPDIIISDYHLNEENTGLDFLTQAQMQFGQTFEGIVLTSDNSRVVEQLVKRAGFHFVTKPIDPESFIIFLLSLVRNRK